MELSDFFRVFTFFTAQSTLLIPDSILHFTAKGVIIRKTASRREYEGRIYKNSGRHP